MSIVVIVLVGFEGELPPSSGLGHSYRRSQLLVIRRLVLRRFRGRILELSPCLCMNEDDRKEVIPFV